MVLLINFIKRCLGIKTPLSPAAIAVLKALYAHEKTLKSLPPSPEKQRATDTCATLHAALDKLRAHHGKAMPSDELIQVYGGPGTKDEP